MTHHMLCRLPLKILAWLAGLVCLTTGADVAHACACDTISPAQGFARTQYVFVGKVVEAKGHTWTVDVDRVWKGADRLAARVRLLDVYKDMDCEFYFEPGRAYLFFAIVAKSSRYVFYQPEVCNWTSALRSKRVTSPHGEIWLEDLIVENYGPGEPPKAEDPWKRLPEHERDERD
ncbi:hypothetical protein [Bradyrhizobium sp. CB3481]|uniref:hypothetical protein n=1 Tax=Bradyrhizobium sp. CB3481 TaxID=3039158 RepID=UPI0024B1A425|nr:hypothetical protein [Bradyrhizobium sp. CB3481]WFU17797.1 hypothetical protein QA643_05470 [Bradyrhizobium sp. CB3481]